MYCVGALVLEANAELSVELVMNRWLGGFLHLIKVIIQLLYALFGHHE